MTRIFQFYSAVRAILCLAQFEYEHYITFRHRRKITAAVKDGDITNFNSSVIILLA